MHISKSQALCLTMRYLDIVYSNDVQYNIFHPSILEAAMIRIIIGERVAPSWFYLRQQRHECAHVTDAMSIRYFSSDIGAYEELLKWLLSEYLKRWNYSTLTEAEKTEVKAAVTPTLLEHLPILAFIH